MKLSELIYAFDMDYLLECSKHDTKRIDFSAGHKALILSKAVNELQKRFGIIECSIQLTSEVGNNFYAVASSFMTPKIVSYGGIPLNRVTAEWIHNNFGNGQPTKYALESFDETAGLLLYPTPINSGDTIDITAELDFALYSPSTSNDFGSFDGTIFSGETAFPTQYDRAILLNMLSQIFPDVIPLYEKEMSLLRVKKFSGEKFSYKMN